MPAKSSLLPDRRAVVGIAAAVAALASGIRRGRTQAAVRTIAVERRSVVSAKPFDDVVTAFESSIARPDVTAFIKELSVTRTYDEMEKVVQAAVGKPGLMEFARFDLGFVLQKEPGSRDANSLRFLVGNPLIMKELVKHLPDAGSYAPVTVLIDQRADGVHLSYDTMASQLSPYGNADALRVARDLDAKIENLCRKAAA